MIEINFTGQCGHHEINPRCIRITVEVGINPRTGPEPFLFWAPEPSTSGIPTGTVEPSVLSVMNPVVFSLIKAAKPVGFFPAGQFQIHCICQSPWKLELINRIDRCLARFETNKNSGGIPVSTGKDCYPCERFPTFLAVANPSAMESLSLSVLHCTSRALILVMVPSSNRRAPASGHFPSSMFRRSNGRPSRWSPLSLQMCRPD